MGRESVVKTIDGEEYTFHQLDPMTSTMILTKILKIAGTSVGMAVDQVAKSGVDNLMDAEVDAVIGKMDISSIVASLCDRLNEVEVREIIIAMTSQVICKGKGEISKVFNEHFKGRILHLIKVVMAAMEVEYADFFAEGFGLQNLLRKAAVTSLKE